MQSMKNGLAMCQFVAFFGCLVAGIACGFANQPIAAGCIAIACAIVFGSCLIARAMLVTSQNPPQP
jgi:hypothetical protein